MFKAYYGKDGVDSLGFDTKEQAMTELHTNYSGEEFKDCLVTYSDAASGYVIAHWGDASKNFKPRINWSKVKEDYSEDSEHLELCF